jgi:hypothetical protein
MPTYRNDTDEIIVSLGIYVEPGKTIQSTKILGNGLTKISDQPYYNPLTKPVHVVTSTGVGDDKTISIDYLNTKSISIFNSSDKLVNVYINQLENSNAIKSYPSTERVIGVDQNVEQLVLQFAGAATVYVEERK